MTAQYQVMNDVALITLANPPMNGLSYATRVAFAKAVSQAQNDPAVKALVVAGAGKAFCSGADITEFGTQKSLQEPNVLSLFPLVENTSKPVIAAIHGICMGGGLELALACHYRMATLDAQVALPEVKLGLIPGAGGTQRLPRALGVESALNMIVSGESVAAQMLAAVPGQKLFDRMANSPETLVQEALTFAREMADVHSGDFAQPLPKLRDVACKHPQAQAFFQFARNTVRVVAKGYPAPLKAIDAVENATKLTFDEGIAAEQALFVELLWTRESRALRHLFFAERAAGKIPDVPSDTPQRAIGQVAVIGAGMMGTGIAMNFLNAGIPVQLLEMRQESLDKGVATIEKLYDAQVAKGKLTPEKRASRMALLSTTLSYDAIKAADLVIEAVFEDMAIKEKVFAQLDAVMKPGAILATNTSTLDVNRIAQTTRRPQDVVGLHFFSPAHVMKLLEVVRGEKTAKDVLATVMALAKKIKKIAVVSGVCDGFIGNRMVEQYVRQAGFLLNEGCTPAQVDKACEDFGFAMGPFRMSDLAGNDIGWAIRKRRAIERPSMIYSKTADLLCEMGRFGQKTGAGWYDYVAGRRDAIPSQTVDNMIAAHRSELGITARKIGNAEIVQRLVYALVNEAAHLLEEGIASKASDIDMVYITGYGFPIYRGGPMHYADEQGLFNVVQAMARFAKNPLDDAQFWQPAPLLARLAASGQTFHSFSTQGEKA